jgi:hypothetical protein
LLSRNRLTDETSYVVVVRAKSLSRVLFQYLRCMIWWGIIRWIRLATQLKIKRERFHYTLMFIKSIIRREAACGGLRIVERNE